MGSNSRQGWETTVMLFLHPLFSFENMPHMWKKKTFWLKPISVTQVYMDITVINLVMRRIVGKVSSLSSGAKIQRIHQAQDTWDTMNKKKRPTYKWPSSNMFFATADERATCCWTAGLAGDCSPGDMRSPHQMEARFSCKSRGDEGGQLPVEMSKKLCL